MDVAARLFQSAPLWLVSQHWFVAPPSSAVNQPPVVQSAPHTSAEMFQLYKERQLKGSILVAGLHPDALPTFQPSCFRMLAMLMERTRAGQPYEAVTAHGVPPGWCPPLVPPTNQLPDPTTGQLPALSLVAGGDMGSAERNAAVQLFSSTPHWFYFYSHDKAAARRSLPRSGSQMLQMYLQGVLADFVPVVGLDYFTHQTLPLCLFVPLGALLGLYSAGKAYSAVNAEDVRAFDRYNVSDAYASVNDARRPGVLPLAPALSSPGSQMPAGLPAPVVASPGGSADGTGGGGSRPRGNNGDCNGSDGLHDIQLPGGRWQTAVFRLFTADSTRGNEDVVWWCADPPAAAERSLVRHSSTGSSMSSGTTAPVAVLATGSTGATALAAALVPSGGSGAAAAMAAMMPDVPADPASEPPPTPPTGGCATPSDEPLAVPIIVALVVPSAAPAPAGGNGGGSGSGGSNVGGNGAGPPDEPSASLLGPMGCENMILAYAGGTVTDGHLVCCTTLGVPRRGLIPPRHCFARLGGLLAEAAQGVRRAPLTPADVQRLAGGLASAAPAGQPASPAAPPLAPAAGGSGGDDGGGGSGASFGSSLAQQASLSMDGSGEMSLGASRHTMVRADSATSGALAAMVGGVGGGRGTGVFAPQFHTTTYDRRATVGPLPPPPPPPARMPRSSDSAAMMGSSLMMMPPMNRRSSWGTPDGLHDQMNLQHWTPPPPSGQYGGGGGNGGSHGGGGGGGGGAQFGGMLGGALSMSAPQQPSLNVGPPAANGGNGSFASRQQLAAAAASYGLDSSQGYSQEVVNMLSGLMVGQPQGAQQQQGPGQQGAPLPPMHNNMGAGGRQQQQQQQMHHMQQQQQQGMLMSHNQQQQQQQQQQLHRGLSHQISNDGGSGLLGPGDMGVGARKGGLSHSQPGSAMWGEAELRALLAASGTAAQPMGMPLSQQQQQQQAQQQLQQQQAQLQQQVAQQGQQAAAGPATDQNLIGEALAMLRFLQQGGHPAGAPADQPC